jgi:glyoxylase-like metal-dependent hydrolase (beta-lactamase superfamily II)
MLSGIVGEGAAQTSYRVRQITESIIVVEAEGTNCIVVQGSDRLAVVDTGPGPEAAAAILSAVESVFGRTDVAFVVSTHCHWDHVDGNQVFDDAKIIAHSQCPAAMVRAFNDRRQISAEPESSEAPPPPPPGVTLPTPDGAGAARTVGSASEDQQMQSGLRERFSRVRLTLPSITFSERLTIDLGGRDLDLVAYGGGHSASDILVVLAGDGVLISGDLFSRGQLPLVTGDGALDPARWVAALGALDEMPEIRTVIPGHGELMTADELRFFKRYVRWLVSETEVGQGGAADSLLQGPLSLKNLPGPRPYDLDLAAARSVHRANVEALVE